MSVDAQQRSRNLCAVSLGQKLKLLGVVGVVGSEPIPGNMEICTQLWHK